MSIPLRDACMEDLQLSVVGIRCGSDLVFGKPVYHECGRPAGYYIEFGDGFTTKRVGPLNGGDMLEYVDGKRI